MKKYIASVNDGGKIRLIESDEYNSMKAFREDLKGNGYRIRFIAKEENFDEACEKYYEICERNKMMKRTAYRLNKEFEERMNK